MIHYAQCKQIVNRWWRKMDLGMCNANHDISSAFTEVFSQPRRRFKAALVCTTTTHHMCCSDPHTFLKTTSEGIRNPKSTFINIHYKCDILLAQPGAFFQMNFPFSFHWGQSFESFSISASPCVQTYKMNRKNTSDSVESAGLLKLFESAGCLMLWRTSWKFDIHVKNIPPVWDYQCREKCTIAESAEHAYSIRSHIAGALEQFLSNTSEYFFFTSGLVVRL